MSGEKLLEYEVPQDVLERIPPCFYTGLAGELVSVFGLDVFDLEEEGNRAVCEMGGTAGYAAAYDETCEKLGLSWLQEYRLGLPWYQSDIFDATIIEKSVDAMDHFAAPSSPYFLHLLQKHEK